MENESLTGGTDIFETGEKVEINVQKIHPEAELQRASLIQNSIPWKM